MPTGLFITLREGVGRSLGTVCATNTYIYKYVFLSLKGIYIHTHTYLVYIYMAYIYIYIYPKGEEYDLHIKKITRA